MKENVESPMLLFILQSCLILLERIGMFKKVLYIREPISLFGDLASNIVIKIENKRILYVKDNDISAE